tara:strand:- start:2138 stop:2338 length:201 start_codon:yes stop_codon:yes gene_type:complete
MVKTSLRLKGPVNIQRHTIDAGPFLAEVMLHPNGAMHIRSLAPTRKARKMHEKAMGKIITRDMRKH